MGEKKKRRAPLVILVLVLIIAGIPLVAIGLSFVGRIAPDSVIPDSFDLYASVPDPLRLAEKVLKHDSLPEIMSLAELAPLMSAANQIKSTGMIESKWVRYVLKGKLDAALLGGGRILGAWDAGIISPFLRFLPALAGRITVPGLYYVRAGKNSRFEYRLNDGTVFFAGPYKNLLVISNNSALFESVLAGSSRDGDRIGQTAKTFYSREYDIAFLLSPDALRNILGSGGNISAGPEDITAADPQIQSALNLLQFPGPVEATLSILPNQLKLNLVTPLGTESRDLRKIIARNSEAAPLSAMIPDSAQYLTLLSAGSLEELINAVSAIAAGVPAGTGGLSGDEWESALRTADRSARFALHMDLEELLLSWTGTQFAVYGLEGRPNPVIAVGIKDEKKRKEVFDKAFKSLFLKENIQLVLDGNRIPRIQVPGFIDALLKLMGVNVPSPYYTVQNGYLLLSESAETLLAAVNAERRNEVLPKTELWRTLSADNSGPSSFSLFYSLDRSFPFFLRGGSAVTAVLRLYRQGLVRLSFEDSRLNVTLSVIPGAGKGVVPVRGYPLDLSNAARDRAGNRLYGISSGRDARLILVRGNEVLALNPPDRAIKEWKFSGAPGSSTYAIPQMPDNSSKGAAEGSAWIADSLGHVSLVNMDLENLKGFPISTGIRLSAPPGAWGSKLFLCDGDGAVFSVDSRAQVSRWETVFPAALRSAPSFLDFKNKSYAAVYPKSLLFAGIWLLDAAGNPLPAWPVPVSGVAFGSPLLFSAQLSGRQERLFAAFITQAGELSVYTDAAELLPGFPLGLEGIFYLQPVFDGESLWIIESEGNLYRIELNGEILCQKVPRLAVREEGFITVADIDGDKRKEIFFSGEGNALYGYSRSFSSLDGFPLPIWGRPFIGDINNDGKQEIAGVGMDNRLYMWQFR